MEFDGFDLDWANRKKCQKHGVSIAQSEELFRGAVLVGPHLRHSAAEGRFRAVGRTADSRGIFVAFTRRQHGTPWLIRPVSARYMHQNEIPAYEEKFPVLRTDEEAEHFVATADLTEYDMSDMVPMRFELRPMDKSVSLRVPEKLLTAVRSRAKRAGIPYQRFIRMALEQAVQEPVRKGRA